MINERYKHWDYWVSSIATWGMAYALAAQLISVWNRSVSCVTFRELGIFILTVVVMFAVTGWNVHVVLDRYPDERRVS